MNSTKNSKLTRVVSTKITDEEFNFFMRLARQYQSQGYIGRATPSEILRLILRKYRRYVLSHTNDQKARDIQTTQSSARMQTNPPMTALGEISASTGHKTDDTRQRVSHGVSIPRGNISSIGSAQQPGSVHGNNKSLAQKVPAGSNNTRNQTQYTYSRMNNVSQPADSRPSQVEKDLNGIHGPSLEFMAEYSKCLRQLGRPDYYMQFPASNT